MNERQAEFEFTGFIVGDIGDLGDNDSRDDILGDETWLENHHHQVDALAIGIGNPAIRLRTGRELSSRYPRLAWPSLIHPSVTADQSSCDFERGVLICAGTVATVNVTVREFAMVNLACTLGHECVIGAGSVLNPTVNVSGGVHIGEGVLIGTGAQILEDLAVDDCATVGAGAVVTRDVTAGATVVGVPAKPVAG
jgi:sugar O-acyltransferase (sialic acid O-acetyltransferase NeuD family)